MPHRILLFLLLTIPISFKVELFSGVRIFVQEPFILLFVVLCNIKLNSLKIKSIPFFFLLASIFIVAVSTIISLFFYFDIVGFPCRIRYISIPRHF